MLTTSRELNTNGNQALGGKGLKRGSSYKTLYRERYFNYLDSYKRSHYSQFTQLTTNLYSSLQQHISPSLSPYNGVIALPRLERPSRRDGVVAVAPPKLGIQVGSLQGLDIAQILRIGLDFSQNRPEVIAWTVLESVTALRQLLGWRIEAIRPATVGQLLLDLQHAQS